MSTNDEGMTNEELIKFLKIALKGRNDISEVEFNGISDKPVSARTYRRRFGSWVSAKDMVKNKRSLREAEELKEKEDTEKKDKEYLEKLRLQDTVGQLKKEVRKLSKERLSNDDVKRHIIGLNKEATRIEVPNWLVDYNQDDDNGLSGMPSVMFSDWHFGESVFPEQVFDCNEYNLEIGKTRVRKLMDNTINLLNKHLVNPSGWPGIVVCLNGDLINGDIHEELSITNDKPIMPIVLEAYSTLIWSLEQFIKYFKNVKVHCVCGNHSRTTKKPAYKNMAYTNYEWLIYQLLNRHFENNPNITFEVADGPDTQFNIYNYRYRMTHGNQFRGGTGFIGPYAPITRGELRKRAAAETYGMNYDLLLIGHFHQFMSLSRVIVNGSVVGYNEYAMGLNFPYEEPCQAMWITHPKNGMILALPVFCK